MSMKNLPLREKESRRYDKRPLRINPTASPSITSGSLRVSTTIGANSGFSGSNSTMLP